jgi:hypothetical protein
LPATPVAQAVESASVDLWKQLQTLIVNPLLQAYLSFRDNQTTAKKWALLIVIDGLDECQHYTVRILLTALIHHKVPLFILMASHPEAPIGDSFNSYDLHELIYTIILDESESYTAVVKYMDSAQHRLVEHLNAILRIINVHPWCTLAFTEI